MYKGVIVVMSDSPGDGTGAPGDRLLRTGEIAERLAPWGISRGTVTEMINSGELGGQPRRWRRDVGKWGRVPESVVEAYIREKLPPLPGTGDQPAG